MNQQEFDRRMMHAECERKLRRGWTQEEIAGVSQMKDGRLYMRTDPQTFTLQRATKKAKGKRARKAERAARRVAREAALRAQALSVIVPHPHPEAL